MLGLGLFLSAGFLWAAMEPRLPSDIAIASAILLLFEIWALVATRHLWRFAVRVTWDPERSALVIEEQDWLPWPIRTRSLPFDRIDALRLRLAPNGWMNVLWREDDGKTSTLFTRLQVREEADRAHPFIDQARKSMGWNETIPLHAAACPPCFHFVRGPQEPRVPSVSLPRFDPGRLPPGYTCKPWEPGTLVTLLDEKYLQRANERLGRKWKPPGGRKLSREIRLIWADRMMLCSLGGGGHWTIPFSELRGLAVNRLWEPHTDGATRHICEVSLIQDRAEEHLVASPIHEVGEECLLYQSMASELAKALEIPCLISEFP